MNRCILSVSVLLIFALSSARPALAQTGSSLSVKVTDSHGAVIPDAQVKVLTSNKAVVMSAKTDGAGIVRLENVQEAAAILEVDANGFQHFSKAIHIQPGSTTIDEDITLEVGNVNESVLVTTALRSPMEIDKSPVSASLVTRDEIEARDARQVDDVLATVEGVNSVRSKGPSDSDFGIGLRGFAGRTLGQERTLVLVDGQPVNNSYVGSVNWATYAPGELERIEVARGPFSSLYGGNAMGGVINLVTRPVDQRQIELFGQYGSRSTANYSVHASERLFQKLGLTFGYNRFQTAGYQPQEVLRSASSTSGGIPVTGVIPWQTTTGSPTYQVGLTGLNWFNQHAYRYRAEYTFSPKLFASVQYMRQTRGSGYNDYTPFLRDSSNNPIDTGTVSFVDNTGVTRHLTLTPSNFLSSSTPSGATVNIYQTQVLVTLSPLWNLRFGAGVNNVPSDWYIAPNSDATLSGGTGSYSRTWAQGLTGSMQISRQSGGQNLIFGTEARGDSARVAAETVPNWAFTSGGVRFDTQAKGKTVSEAAYVQYQRSVTESLNVVVGGRWDNWTTYDGSSQATTSQPLVGYSDRSASDLTGKLAAAYTLPKGWQVRGSIGSAFRDPSIYEMYRTFVLAGNLYIGNPLVKPERLISYEGGVTHNFGDGHSVSGTLFENQVTDLIYRVTDLAHDPTGLTHVLTNAGQSRTRGAEIALRQRVTSWLQFKESYTYTNNVITKNDPLPATVGKRVPYVPRNMLSYVAMASKKRWSASWAGRYVSTEYTTDTNTDSVHGVPGSFDPFFEMEATASVSVNRRLSFVVNGDNLLDRRYHLYYLSQPRTIYAGLRIRVF